MCRGHGPGFSNITFRSPSEVSTANCWRSVLEKACISVALLKMYMLSCRGHTFSDISLVKSLSEVWSLAGMLFQKSNFSKLRHRSLYSPIAVKCSSPNRLPKAWLMLICQGHVFSWVLFLNAVFFRNLTGAWLVWSSALCQDTPNFFRLVFTWSAWHCQAAWRIWYPQLVQLYLFSAFHLFGHVRSRDARYVC